jgi:hypothetical protein
VISVYAADFVCEFVNVDLMGSGVGHHENLKSFGLLKIWAGHVLVGQVVSPGRSGL